MKPITKNYYDSLTDFFWPFSKSYNKGIMKTDISNRKGNYVLDIEIPGYQKDEIKVQLKDGYLNVWTEKHQETCECEWVSRERFDGDVSRSYYVGCSNESDVNATYHNGILTVVIPEESDTNKDTSKYINIK